MDTYNGINKDGVAQLLTLMQTDFDNMYDYQEDTLSLEPWTVTDSINWLHLSQGIFDITKYIEHLEEQLSRNHKFSINDRVVITKGKNKDVVGVIDEISRKKDGTPLYKIYCSNNNYSFLDEDCFELSLD